MNYFNFDSDTVHRSADAAYDQGVEDGIRKERERIRTALLSDGAIEEVELMLDRLKWAHAPHAKAVTAAEIFVSHIGLGEEQTMTMSSETAPREALASAIDMQMIDCYVEKDGETLQVGDHRDIAMGVIAHLWQRADGPEFLRVIDAVCSIHGMTVREAERLIDDILTALIGPKPDRTGG